MGIEWVQVRGYEGLYEVSEEGKVRNCSDCNLRKRTGNDRRHYVSRGGYLAIQLTGRDGKRKAFYLHRLVMCNFVGESEGMEVNHIDCDKTNNHLSNLEWVTREGNTKHKLKNGLQTKGTDIWSNKLSEDDVIFIRENYKPRDTLFGARALARRFKVVHSTIGAIINNQSWTHIK